MSESIAESAVDILRTAGPMTLQSLLEQLAERGHRLTAAKFDDIWLSDGFDPCSQDYLSEPSLYYALDTVFAGRILTHRLTSTEIDGHHLELTPDLLPLWILMDEAPFDLLDGQPIEQGIDGELSRIGLAPGVFAGRTPGSLIGLRVTPTGFHLEDIDQTASLPPELTDEVFEFFDEDEEYVPQIEISDLVHHLCLRHPDLFIEPTAPIGELIDELGLEERGDYVTLPGALWDDEDSDLEELIRAYRLNPDQAVAVRAFAQHTALAHGALHEWEDAGRPEELPLEFEVTALIPFLPELADANTAEAILGQCAASSEHQTAVLHGTLTALAPHTPRRAQPALHWLLGSCADRLRDITGAEKEWETAIRLGSDFAPALIDLAGLASDRGDAQRAVSLLRRAEVEPDDSLLAMVSRYLTSERTDIGRNSPCWCGSGRKYKACHLRDTSFTVGERRDWIYHKVSHWVQASWGRPLMFELAQIRAQHWKQSSAMLDALVDPLILDAAIFEGDGLGEFLAARGSLLPADEQLVAASWQTSQRSLFEVTAVQRGHGFTVRNVRTGDILDIVERLGSQQVTVGLMLCLRLLGAGDAAPSIFGGIDPVPDYLVEAALAMLDLQDTDEEDPRRTVGVLSARFSPPELRTAEGDPLVMCSATLSVTTRGRTGFIRYLDAEFGTGNDKVWTWTVPADIGDRILGMITADGGTFTVNATSERRFDELLNRLVAAHPKLTIVNQERVAGGDSVVERGSTPSPVDPTDPAVKAVLDQYFREYEDRWLDDSIPALGGATPRQAADDPTRRGDLIRLLNSFDDLGGGSATMDVGRLRAALGLIIDA